MPINVHYLQIYEDRYENLKQRLNYCIYLFCKYSNDFLLTLSEDLFEDQFRRNLPEPLNAKAERSNKWTVNYGDGTGSLGLPLNSDKTFALNNTFPSNGLYSVTVIVRDDDLGVGSATLKAAVGLQIAIAPTSTNYVALTCRHSSQASRFRAPPASPPANRTPIPDTANLVGSQWLVAVPATNTARFFRLVAP